MTSESGENTSWATADKWKSAAITMAIFTPIVAAFALPWVFAAVDDAALLHRVQIVGAGVAVGLALVTFSTVLWRGMIATEQAKLQRVQIEKLAEQIAATKESNLADLLQRGAELLSERSKPAHVAAGIAILQSVVVNESGTFAVEAMDLLADFVSAEFREEHSMSIWLGSAAQALRLGARKGRYSRRTLSLTMNSDDQWHFPIVGVRRVLYNNGTVYDGFLDSFIDFDSNYRFKETKFFSCDVDIDSNFMNCYFEGCLVKSIKNPRSSSSNRFKNCDFSGARIRAADDFHALELLEGNWFDPVDPPICNKGDVIWGKYLATTRPDDDIPF